MRAGTDAEVVAEGPVIEVVARTMPRACVRGDLVVAESRLRGHALDALLHLGRHVVVRQHRGLGREQRVRLEREVVVRQVRRRQGERLCEVALEPRHVLAGQCVHQVEVEGRKVAGRRLGRRDRLGPVVHPTQRRKRPVIETLHAERQPIDAGLAESAKAFALERAGIGLQRHLGIDRHAQHRPYARQQPVDRLGREEAWGAAADEDRLQRSPPHHRQRRLQVRRQCLDVLRLG